MRCSGASVIAIFAAVIPESYPRRTGRQGENIAARSPPRRAFELRSLRRPALLGALSLITGVLFVVETRARSA